MAKYTKTSKEMLLDAINIENNLQNNPLTWNQIAAGFPEKVTSAGADKNTRLIIYGLKQGGYKGTVTLKYDRISLPEIFRNVTPVVVTEPVALLSQLLPKLNKTYGLSLDKDDIIEQSVADLGEDFLITVQLRSGCVAWEGDFELRFTKFRPKLKDVIADNVLDVIVAPFPMGAKPRAEYVAYGYDYSTMGETFKTWAVNRTLTQDDIDELNETVQGLKLVNKTGANAAAGEIALSGAKVTSINTVTANSLFNIMYEKAIVITLAATSNYEGQLIIHYSSL
ncbi:hypothetical protein D6R99_07830 [Salmonella enterica subsp. enterica]|nr:hypothetical protein [Salmonella enterica subsp. enterica serovar Paratyphi B]EDD7889920.1 hypothetical protein [Salmonella enterica subsp. enterica serovar Enteritidis]EIP7032402.1 hypothetical protein [Salmonella enterica]